MKQSNLKPRQFLLCGLDYSGKTTMIKRHVLQSGGKPSVYTDEIADIITTTPFINVEQVKLSGTSEQAIVYDLSG